jgi:hypothetical protein
MTSKSDEIRMTEESSFLLGNEKSAGKGKLYTLLYSEAKKWNRVV